MDERFNLYKLLSTSINDPTMISKYASLGYFHFVYIASLDPYNTCENLVRDRGLVRGTEDKFIKGDYIKVSLVDFNKKRKIVGVFKCKDYRLEVSVGDLTNLCRFLNTKMDVNSDDCFVKFDACTVVIE